MEAKEDDKSQNCQEKEGPHLSFEQGLDFAVEKGKEIFVVLPEDEKEEENEKGKAEGEERGRNKGDFEFSARDKLGNKEN